jgi:hypothetical protein
MGRLLTGTGHGRARACGAAALAFAVLGATPALAAVPHPHTGRLPGFPRYRGVMPVRAPATAVRAREGLIAEAFAAARRAARARGGSAPAPQLEPNPRGGTCPLLPYAVTGNVCYEGGPVLHEPPVHLIFWQGKPGSAGEEKVLAFPGHYKETIERYFGDVAAATAAGAPGNVYAADAQYAEAPHAGLEKVRFGAGDAVVDAESFPVHEATVCERVKEAAEGPCVLDKDIQEVVSKQIAANPGWGPPGVGNLYYVFTAPGVGSCASFGCAYRAYCGYHGDFGGNGLSVGEQSIYANIPFAGASVEGEKVCDSAVHPSEEKDEGTDAAIDVVSHELSEAITDPLGSQCKNAKAKECEPFSWTDIIGQEIGDKCVPPDSTIFANFNQALEAPFSEALTATPFAAINQLINGHGYWTQTEWSNDGGESSGACVQRLVKANFAQSSAITFDASSSGEAGDPIVYWVWNFEAGVSGAQQFGTAEPVILHAYPVAGPRPVTLTVFDKYGNSNTVTKEIEGGTQPPPPAPAPPAGPTVVTATTTTSVTSAAPVAKYSASQLAGILGLPRAGAKLPGLGTITVGHGACPPACSVSARLIANVTTSTHHRRVTKTVQIGSAMLAIASGGTGTIALQLNSSGRSLLRRQHTLSVQLQLTVGDQEGGNWQLSRSFTLTATGSKSAHPRH